MEEEKNTKKKDWKYIRQGFIALAVLTLFLSLGLMYVFYYLGFSNGVLSVYEKGIKSPIVCPGSEDKSLLNADAENSEEESKGEETVEYAIEELTEGVTYDPLSDEYYGFRTCDYEMSTCTVYGIEMQYVDDFEIGQQYRIYFNELGEGGAAAGTSYIPVIGEAEVIVVE